ncbi:hypothetical protein H4R20_001406 [Coemansia guatemalensis]|uniref:Uncharacterized protein n=1 Tax=Coemansia guatemalensis TaxID=2761395 RepID=A0A9W8LW12_9FUNG|nr:hypothetical protein H4R20_001406 [Coemansia guatemalensis]
MAYNFSEDADVSDVAPSSTNDMETEASSEHSEMCIPDSDGGGAESLPLAGGMTRGATNIAPQGTANVPIAGACQGDPGLFGLYAPTYSMPRYANDLPPASFVSFANRRIPWDDASFEPESMPTSCGTSAEAPAHHDASATDDTDTDDSDFVLGNDGESEETGSASDELSTDNDIDDHVGHDLPEREDSNGDSDVPLISLVLPLVSNAPDVLSTAALTVHATAMRDIAIDATLQIDDVHDADVEMEGLAIPEMTELSPEVPLISLFSDVEQMDEATDMSMGKESEHSDDRMLEDIQVDDPAEPPPDYSPSIDSDLPPCAEMEITSDMALDPAHVTEGDHTRETDEMTVTEYTPSPLVSASTSTSEEMTLSPI